MLQLQRQVMHRVANESVNRQFRLLVTMIHNEGVPLCRSFNRRDVKSMWSTERRASRGLVHVDSVNSVRL